jgi:hypothetical protein
MKHLFLTAAILATTPLHAGGPVIATEEPYVAEARPSSEGRWVLPVIVTLVAICAIACGGDKDSPAPVKPVDPCNGCQ